MRFINLPKSKSFHIATRFYDPQKEAMKEREERMRKELEGNSDGPSNFHYGASIKGSFRNASKINSKTVMEARRRSNKRVIYILLALMALLYLLMK